MNGERPEDSEPGLWNIQKYENQFAKDNHPGGVFQPDNTEMSSATTSIRLL